MKKASQKLLLFGGIVSIVYCLAMAGLGIGFAISKAASPAIFFIFAGIEAVNAVLSFLGWKRPRGGLMVANVIFGVVSCVVLNTVGGVFSAKVNKYMLFKRKHLSIPYFLFLVLFVLIPIVIIVVYAFTDTVTLADGTEALTFSFKAFVSFFTNWTKINVLIVSLFIGLLNTILCLLIGYPIAYLLADKKVNKNYVLVMLFIMPMWINFVLRTGATRDVLSWMGLYGGQHPYVATMIGMVYNYLPFTILPLYSTMIKLDKAQIEAAHDLGCNGPQTFFHSILPQSVPGIIAAAEMVFMPTMSSYVISDTLSEGKLTLFGNIIYLNFSQYMWNEGSFMALIMLAMIVIGMMITKRFGKQENPRKGVDL